MKNEHRGGKGEGFAEERIREEFLALLRKKSVERITVAELCGRCGINRSTFYRHYEDLYALMESVCAEAHARLFYDVIREVDYSENFGETGYSYILRVCERTKENEELYRLLLSGNASSRFQERMAVSAYQFFIAAHEGPTGLRPAETAFLHYQFLVSGVIGIWSAWVQEGCRTPSEALAGAVKEELISFYETMHRLYGRA